MKQVLRPVRILCVFLALLLVAGCGASSTAPAQTPAPGTAPAGQSGSAASKTELIIAMGEDIAGLDPFAQNSTIQNVYTNLMYDTLLDMDNETGETRPGLAESYTIISNMEYEFKLRPNVKFHDGSVLKASDVKFSLERAAASAGMAPKVSSIKEVQVIDDLTVRILLNVPTTTILNVLSFCGTSIMSEEFCKKNADRFANNGTGPYKFREWNSGDSITFDRNEDYWGEVPKMPTLKFVVMPEAASRTIALETGEIDVNSSLAAIDISKIESNPALSLYQRVSGKVDYIGMNNSAEYTSNLKVRQAIAHAINKQEVVDVLLEGRGEVTNTILGKGQNYYDGTLKGYEYNPEKSRQLLEEAGYPDGFPLTMHIRTARDNIIAQLIQAQLLEVGITAKIERMENAIFLDLCKSGTIGMICDDWQPATSDADNPLRGLMYSTNSGTNNRVWYRNTDYDAMLDEAITLTDPAQAQALYSKVQKHIEDNVPLIPMFSEYWIVATNAHVKGVTIPAVGDTLPYHLFYWEA